MVRTLLTALTVGVLALAPSASAVTIIVTTDEDIDPGGPTPATALRACPGGHGLSDVTPEAADIEVAGCSLRMALLAAAANSSVVDAIHFDPLLAAPDKTIKVSEDVPLPPIAQGRLTIDGCNGQQSPTGPCVNLELPKDFTSVGLTSLSLHDQVPGATVPEDPGLTVLAGAVTIKGIAFQNGSPAIWAPPGPLGAANSGLKVSNSYFGLRTDGATGSPPLVGIQLAGDGATIGQPGPGARNVFATGEIGVLIAGGSRNTVQGNWFGTGDNGRPLTGPGAVPRLGTGVRLVGLGYDVTTAVDGVRDLAGQPPPGADPLEALADSLAGEPLEQQGVFSLAVKNTIGGSRQGPPSSCTGACNLFASLTGQAIDLGAEPLLTGQLGMVDTEGETVGVFDTEVDGNQLGVDAVGAPAPNEGGIVVRNGSRGTHIGGDASRANVISNAKKTAGVAVFDDAGLGTVFEGNLGQANKGLLYDLGPAGLGNHADGPSGGIQAPAITAATTTSASGTAVPGGRVEVYRAPPTPHASGAGDVEAVVGSATANGSGQWTAPISVPGGRRVTALVTGAGGSSELARNFLVPEPPPSPTEPPPSPPLPPPTPRPEPSPPTDRRPPRIVSVLGDNSPRRSTPIPLSGSAKALHGRLADPAGVAAVRVALRVVPARKRSRGSARARKRTCTFVHLTRARLVKRSCSRPLYARARGAERWRVPLKAKVRRILRRNSRYQLYVRATDKLGNTTTRTYLIQIRGRALRR